MYVFLVVGLFVGGIYVRRYALMQNIEASDGFVGIEFTVPAQARRHPVLVVSAPICFVVHDSFVIPQGPVRRTFHRLAILGVQTVVDVSDTEGRKYLAAVELPPILPGKYILGLRTNGRRCHGHFRTEVMR